MSSQRVIENGFYGKIPSVGDFVYRRLPREFITPWDQWLQQGITASKVDLGDKWLDRYLISPIWRFILTEGICGETGWAGILVPSIDKIGRYFPLTIAIPTPEGTNPMRFQIEGKAWFDDVEDVVLSLMEDDGIKLDKFDQMILDVKNSYFQEGHAVMEVSSTISNSWHIPIEGASDLLEVNVDLSHYLASQLYGSYSYWFTDGSDYVDPNILLCKNLPNPIDFTAFFDGQWERGSWYSWNDFSPVQCLEAIYAEDES